ncbi:transporter substrate-binding domain-containing protein [Halobacteriovorax sp. HFRX-2_2]|uniref:substrate-binding periplasmic protein n=1 Tax=unclassified Halobacteriovorax TaxID=2639665 RepID=UPI00371F4082
MLKIKHLFTLILFHVALLNASFASEIKTIEISTPKWDGFTNKDGSGLYFELVKKAYSLSNIKVNYTFVPWPRAVKYVNENHKDAMLGAYNSDPESIYPNYPIDVEYTLVIYKKNSLKDWQGVESLKGKEVYWVRGYNYHEYIKTKLDWRELQDTNQGLKLLEKDRIKFFIDSNNTLKPKLKEFKIDLKDYEIKPVITKFLYVRFSRTKKSQELIKIFDKNMATLLKTKDLEKIYKKWNHKMPDFSAVKK